MLTAEHKLSLDLLLVQIRRICILAADLNAFKRVWQPCRYLHLGAFSTNFHKRRLANQLVDVVFSLDYVLVFYYRQSY